MAATDLPPWKQELIDFSLSNNILTFGTYKLKSNRISPYFVNCGLFCRAKLIRAISSAYARMLHDYSNEHPEFEFDVLFGPAYKGIPLCATTAEKLAALDEQKWGDVGYSFNRKEVKDHGEGGLIVGESLEGKRVVVIDDVMTVLGKLFVRVFRSLIVRVVSWWGLLSRWIERRRCRVRVRRKGRVMMAVREAVRSVRCGERLVCLFWRY